MKIIYILLVVLGSCFTGSAQTLVAKERSANTFDLAQATIYVDAADHPLVQTAAAHLQADLQKVLGKKLPLVNQQPTGAPVVIIIGSADKSRIIKDLSNAQKINTSNLSKQWEGYQIKTFQNPFKGVQQAVVITGSDRRGTAYGVFELSKQTGVSPWYWWADVPVKGKKNIFINKNITITDAPKVMYRGIFINDEAPALSSWTYEKNGGFNSKLYEKVFELMIRLKANYLWPAMWGNAFYDDDSLNIKKADQWGIVIGTSHHEPLMRAHDEWRRYGKGQWNYDSNAKVLQQFWRSGMQRATNEKIVSIGMRGDGDEPMTEETATALLERIVADQRKIIAEVTGRPAGQTPQLWALYKEVQDYYDKGMRVPDDVTLLLCDDNWGNIRRLPKTGEKARSGGYGIYYHFDYVGGPRNYKWLNTNPIPRVWEQMHLAWKHGVDRIWIVNVGDIKPMEFPISFFLDYAWNPDRIGADDLAQYTRQWAAAQFGEEHAGDIGDIVAAYGKYSGRRKPELLDADTYSLHHYNEWERVVKDFKTLLAKAEAVNSKLAPQYKDAYFQLVLHPVLALSNLYDMYYNVAMNRWLASNNNPAANRFADSVKHLYVQDSLITLEYHRLNGGKWNGMMSQTHIGYTYWQQPEKNKMPDVVYVPAGAKERDDVKIPPREESAETLIPSNAPQHVFYENNGYVSFEAHHFTRAVNSNGIQWKVLPDLGRTGSAITTFPVTATRQTLTTNTPHLQYEVYAFDTGMVKLHLYFSPTLNIYNLPTGMQYAVSIDDEAPQIVSVNKEDNITSVWEGWVANNIIIKTTQHRLSKGGKHVIRYWMVDNGLVLQKGVLDAGGMQPSYLGPPETKK